MAYLSDWKALDIVISAVSGVQAVVGIPSKLLKSGNQRKLEKAIGAFERDLIIPKYETDQQKMKKGTRINLHKCNQIFCLPLASSEQCSDNGRPHSCLVFLFSPVNFSYLTAGKQFVKHYSYWLFKGYRRREYTVSTPQQVQHSVLFFILYSDSLFILQY